MRGMLMLEGMMSMSKGVTLELPDRIEAALKDATREEGLSAGEIVAAALDDYFFIRQFRRMREKMLAQAPRDITDEEVFESVS